LKQWIERAGGGQPRLRAIVNSSQIQTRRRKGSCRQRTIASRQDLTDPLWGFAAQANLNQSPHQIADHMMQKGIGRHDEFDKLAALPNLEPTDAANRRAGLALRRSKGREIVFAHQRKCSRLNCCEIERLENPSRTPGPERVHHWRYKEQIAIRSRAGRKACVELIIHRLRPLNSQVI